MQDGLRQVCGVCLKDITPQTLSSFYSDLCTECGALWRLFHQSGTHTQDGHSVIVKIRKINGRDFFDCRACGSQIRKYSDYAKCKYCGTQYYFNGNAIAHAQRGSIKYSVDMKKAFDGSFDITRVFHSDKRVNKNFIRGNYHD